MVLLVHKTSSSKVCFGLKLSCLFICILECSKQVADREMSEAKVELARSRTELERQDMELAQLRSEASRLSQDNKNMRNALNTQSNNMSQLESLVHKLQDDKKKLSARVNKLISTGMLFLCVLTVLSQFILLKQE